MVFFRTTDSGIPLGWMAGVRDVAEVGRYDWGSTALAHLYLGLDEASRNVKNVGGRGGERIYCTTTVLVLRRDDPHLTADLETVDPLAVYGERFRALAAAPREADVLSRRRVVFLSSKVRAWYLGDRVWRQLYDGPLIPYPPP
ncbi:hypothetical protein FRX31_021863 [Thalictrum thalictroides]|uniref:Uncharacterized protein n=1 Tax=Thalictrum thalictroides TaxID=46969 RepID=A0A7J6VTY4_THATH|nr:hypothetical protein FRX31_021863 [Thalictrum thalictroides]